MALLVIFICLGKMTALIKQITVCLFHMKLECTCNSAFVILMGRGAKSLLIISNVGNFGYEGYLFIYIY